MSLPTVEDLWHEYSSRVMREVPRDSVQWRESKLAFCSGIFCLLSAQAQHAPADEAAGVRWLRSLDLECVKLFDEHFKGYGYQAQFEARLAAMRRGGH